MFYAWPGSIFYCNLVYAWCRFSVRNHAGQIEKKKLFGIAFPSGCVRDEETKHLEINERNVFDSRSDYNTIKRGAVK